MRTTLGHQAKCKVSGYLLFLFFLILFAVHQPVTAYGQSDYKTPVINPSPTSAVFSRYGNDQPYLQSGTVNIPISLFEIAAPGISIPFTMSYQTSGINIADTPYPAGYGWVFSSGFRISRTILGRPDERFAFKALNGSTNEYDSLKRGILNEQIANAHLLNESDLFDSQKDIFNLHLPSGSYKFFINKVGSSYEVVSIGHQLKIEALQAGTGLTGFKVTDDKGIVYMYGYDNPSTFAEFTEPSELSVPSAWVLREIILLNQEKFTFSWQKVNVNAYAVRTNIPISVIDYKAHDCNHDFAHEVNDYGGIIDHSSYSGANSLMLKKIEYPGGVVDLTYKSSNDPFLQAITLKNKRNETVKSISLSFGANNPAADHALLQSLNVNGEVYSFQYNANRFWPQSTALDYWGFYNGKENNSSLVPKMTLQLYTGATPWYRLPPNINVEVGYADKSISAEHMKAFMLTKINFPTGGYSEYEYEPHEFSGHSVKSTGLFQTDPNPISRGGGLRVSQIRSYALGESVPIIKTYKYGSNEDGLANNSVVPTLDTFIDEFWLADESLGTDCNIPTKFPIRRVMKINSLSNYSKFLIDKNPIWYSQVTEYVGGELKTEYAFTYNDTYGISWQLTANVVKSPYAFRYDNLFNKGPLLTSTTAFKKSGSIFSPVKKIVNQYETASDLLRNISSAIIDRAGIVSHNNMSGPDTYPPSHYNNNSNDFLGDIRYLVLPYHITVQHEQLKKATTTIYENGETLVSDEDYVYSGAQLVKKINSSSILGKDVTVEYKYPNHFSEPVYQAMVTKNILSPVIEEKTLVGVNITKRVRRSFTNDIAVANGLIVPSSIATSYGSAGAYINEVEFEKYDAKGNILQKSYFSGPKTSYLWAYQSQYPVAEIKGVDYATVVAALGGQPAVDVFAGSIPSNDQDIRSFVAPLRTSLPTAFTSTYTYKPLVGMTSETDPKDMITYYTYDGFGRLENIKDRNEHIVKNYQYNYSNGTVGTTYYNVALSGYYTKNNCAVGQEGSTIYHTIPANTYLSLISQADADQKAVTAAQNYINANGLCNIRYYNTAVTVSRTKDNCPTGQTGSLVYYTVAANSHSSIISQADADQKALDAANFNVQFYANLQGTCSSGTITYYNTVLTVSKTKDNCGSGQTGSSVNYTVAANSYSSTISQADANQKAQNDADANAQNYANANGSCVPNTIIYYNTVLTVSKTKDNCGSGQTGSAVNYTVVANSYSSTTSQADADLQAQADADANAQNYANANGNCVPNTITYYNVALTVSKTKDNCGSGQTGSTVNYTVAANSYSSTISQADADLQAQADVNANAQNYANAQGSCSTTYYNAALTVSKTKNNCNSGQNGSTVNYMVAAGTYSSIISQADANQKAQNDADANAQNYANAQGSCSITYYNSTLTVSKTKNSCSIGQVGSVVEYTVAYGTYSSTISQADADQKAQNDADVNAQNYANSNGTCSTPVYINFGILYGREFRIGFYNTSTSVWTYFTISSASSGGIQIPEGNYTVTINEVNYDGSFVFYFNNEIKYGGNNVQFTTAFLSGGIHLEITE